MKVGIYSNRYHQESGGAYTFEQEILRSLIQISSESPHEFVIIHNQPRLLEIQILDNNENLQIERIEKIKPKPSLSRFLRRKILRKGNKNKISSAPTFFSDVITQKKIELLWFLTPIHVLVDIPYIATIWDIQHRVQPWFPEVGTINEWEGREQFYAQYIQRATYIITPSQVGQEEIAFYYQIPPERFIKLPHPAPKIFLLESNQIDVILEKYHLTKQGYLFYPALLWPHKNHVNLLHALKILREEYNISFPLVLTGSDKGNKYHIMSKAKEIGVEEQVLFLGFIPRDELIALYQGAFALTYLSLFGPENLPPLEAFSCGCPVVIARVAGSEEQFKDAAFFVEGTMPNEIADAINSLYIYPHLREELINKGYIRAAELSGIDYVRGVFSALNRFESVRQNWGEIFNKDSNTESKSKQ